MKFKSWQSGSTLFVDNVEVGQQRNCKALFKNHFHEQLHSQAAKEKDKRYLTCRITTAQMQRQGQVFASHPG